jgi:hypothetical protein
LVRFSPDDVLFSLHLQQDILALFCQKTSFAVLRVGIFSIFCRFAGPHRFMAGNRNQLILVASHPFRRKKRKGWGTERLWRNRAVTLPESRLAEHPPGASQARLWPCSPTRAWRDGAASGWTEPRFSRMMSLLAE